MENTTNELHQDFAKAIRSLLNLAIAQQGMLERLYRAHDALLTALGSAGPSGAAIDVKVDAIAQREIDELRRMFGEKAEG
jgi:hypothetical protein